MWMHETHVPLCTCVGQRPMFPVHLYLPPCFVSGYIVCQGHSLIYCPWTSVSPVLSRDHWDYRYRLLHSAWHVCLGSWFITLISSIKGFTHWSIPTAPCIEVLTHLLCQDAQMGISGIRIIPLRQQEKWTVRDRRKLIFSYTYKNLSQRNGYKSSD